MTKKEAIVAQKKTEDIEDATLELATPPELIRSVLEQLGYNPASVASVEIASERVRVLGKDRSFRSHRIEQWNAEVAE